jgi:hypothetical protein
MFILLRRLFLVAFVVPASFAMFGCSSGESPEGAGGTGGGVGATSGTGGAIAGTSGTGGGSGGSVAGTGGAGGTTGGVGGSGAASGAGTAGGSAGAAGSIAAGGAGGSGATGGDAGAGAGSGGTAGAAGAAGAGMSGAAGTGGGSAGTSGNPECSDVAPIAGATCTAGESNCFSFFVASRARMFAAAEAFNGSMKGWGGDFRYGTADGLTGADKLCTEIAEASLPGNCRTWRAFLSTSTVDAIDRVGSGPWYDRLNRTIANNLTELVETRPGGITVSSILNNLPNEDGTPHHNEEVGCTDLNDCADNHDVLTGSDTDGRVCTAETCAGIGGFPGGPGGGTELTDQTCEDWTLGTSKSGIAPRCGHTWPTGGGGGGMMGGGDDWISHLTENGCAPGFNLVQDGGPMPNGLGTVGDGGGYGAIYCLALSN